MANKQIDLQGYGRIVIVPINFKDKEYETVDMEGNALTYQKGTTERGRYTNEEGIEVPSSHLCKKIEIDGETIIQPKMTPTKEVEEEDIEVIDDNGQLYSAIDRKIYSVFTENSKIKDLILKQNKSLRFPFIAGSGYKIYEAILTAWQDKIILCGCRGDIQDALKMYSDEIVDIEISLIPEKPQTKRLMKALATARY